MHSRTELDQVMSEPPVGGGGRVQTLSAVSSRRNARMLAHAPCNSIHNSIVRMNAPLVPQSVCVPGPLSIHFVPPLGRAAPTTSTLNAPSVSATLRHLFVPNRGRTRLLSDRFQGNPVRREQYSLLRPHHTPPHCMRVSHLRGRSPPQAAWTQRDRPARPTRA